MGSRCRALFWKLKLEKEGEVQRWSMDSETIKGRNIFFSVEEARASLRTEEKKLMVINKKRAGWEIKVRGKVQGRAQKEPHAFTKQRDGGQGVKGN